MPQFHDRRTEQTANEAPEYLAPELPIDAQVVVDIHAELAYWEQAYRSSGFHRPDFVFEDYRPSLKFAYDAYLRCHRQSLQSVLPTLQQKYQSAVPSADRLEWGRMTQVVIAVWARLLRNGARNAKAKAWIAGPGADLKTANRLRPTVARLQNVTVR